MKIRSITCFINPKKKMEIQISKASRSVKRLKEALAYTGFEVQTSRIATTPFPRWLELDKPSTSFAFLKVLEEMTITEGFDFISIGPAETDFPASYDVIPEILGSSNLFASGMVTSSNRSLAAFAVKACAKIIQQLSTATPDGFTNLRFAALGNVPPSSPFFPSAYASSTKLGLGFAIEGADLAIEEFSRAASISDAQTNLTNRIHSEVERIQIAAERSGVTGSDLLGFDFTLAPFPEEERSIGTALEKLGLPALGQAGSVTTAAILMSVMQGIKIPRIGFNGLMLPVLEDSILARRAAEGSLGIQDLLLYAAVCGTGLDTIPLPGDISVDQLYAILMDFGALSLRLNKPLTARLMPIPGKKIGDKTEFDFSYFSNSRVMDPDSNGLTGLLALDGAIPISAR